MVGVKIKSSATLETHKQIPELILACISTAMVGNKERHKSDVSLPSISGDSCWWTK